MARNYMFGRQEAEALVDLLEENPDYQLHDHTALDMATELRLLFGMCTKEQELENKRIAAAADPGTRLVIDTTVFEGDFGNMKFSP